MEKVRFDYKDLALASYLIINGNKFVGTKITYVKRFNEFKIFVQVEGIKDQLNSMKDFYEENKLRINKRKDVSDMIIVLADIVEKSLKNKEEESL